jgi:hypothetical protein
MAKIGYKETNLTALKSVMVSFRTWPGPAKDNVNGAFSGTRVLGSYACTSEDSCAFFVAKNVVVAKH